MLTLASRPLGDLASTLTSPLMIPSHFLSWTVGETPFSTHKSIISLLLLYLVTVLGGAQLMVDRKPLSKSNLRDFFKSQAKALCSRI